MAILETRGLRKIYGSGDTEVRALDGVDLTVEKGEFAAVVGTSGSGKSTLKDEKLTIFRRRKIGFVFQNYNLMPVLNVYENIVLPNNLSGGQQQRVSIARALAAKPAIILADEPTGNLDSRTSQDVMSLLKVTSQRFAQTIVMITHNEEIAQMADRIIRIEDGRIVVRG